jgi:hypothetical protein
MCRTRTGPNTRQQPLAFSAWPVTNGELKEAWEEAGAQFTALHGHSAGRNEKTTEDVKKVGLWTEI